MATTQPLVVGQDLKTRTYNAEEALVRGRLVIEGATAGGVKYPATADLGGIVGVTLNDAAINEQVEVAYEGIVPVYTNTTVAIGVPVANYGADGTVKTAAPAAGANSFLLGFARTGVTGAGWILVKIALSVMQGA